ncbi:MAG: tRNA dihydrouridine(20/20a) synthase DusA [Alphaproteobacteria bacterium]|nr:tRNA dihydrouridine(20/20a) synthase DusA [Alphaproteobacteria bacterium]
MLFDNKFSVAPMMDWTDQHCRYFHRLISSHAVLYTEMISADALLFGPREKLLSFNKEELPCVLQLGGNNPDKLSKAAKYGQDNGYSEINLNIGCPSNRVQNGSFGACLMETPKLVAECVKVIQENCQIPVTIKCRIGIDDMDEIKGLDDFVDEVSLLGTKLFIIHARKALLNGLSPKQNREIPPLNYLRVGSLKKRRPDLKIIINGGIQSIEDGNEIILKHNLDGYMIGREAYKNPYILSTVDRDVFGKDVKQRTRYEVAMKMADYIDNYMKKGGSQVHAVTRHMLGLYNSLPGAKDWRRVLSENTKFSKNGDVLRLATDNIEDVIHRKNLKLA